MLHYGDLTDSSDLIQDIQQVQPHEIYNLGALGHVAVGFEARSTPPTAMRLARCGFWKQYESGANGQKYQIYQASTSELYGLVQETHKRNHPFYPRSLWRGQICLLDHGELPRSLCMQRHPFQP